MELIEFTYRKPRKPRLLDFHLGDIVEIRWKDNPDKVEIGTVVGFGDFTYRVRIEERMRSVSPEIMQRA